MGGKGKEFIHAVLIPSLVLGGQPVVVLPSEVVPGIVGAGGVD